MPEDTAVEYWWRNRNFPRDKAIVPGTDEVIHRGSAEQCYEAWSARCAQLGLTFDNEWATYGNCCCLALPTSLRDEACAKMSDAAPEVLRQKRLIGWRDIKAFFAKVASWWKAGECVSQDEADRRAAICAGCELNQSAFLPGCPGCTNMAAEVFKFIGGKKTASDAALKSCGHCGCQNSVIVWAPLDVLVSNETELPPVPAWCWKRLE
jgi:hypothetical protein